MVRGLMDFDGSRKNRAAGSGHGAHARASDAAGPTPGKSTLTEKLVQRKAEQAPSAPAAESWQRATSGAATDVPHRGRMEAAFGRSFGDVRAYAGGDHANAGLSGLGAVAAAHGNQVAFRDASPSPGLVAHELAHVVQQQGGAAGVQAKAVGAAGGGAEQRADAAADAVVRGLPVPDVGAADSDLIHCAPVDTYGGSWDTTAYTPVGGAGTGGAGLHVHLKFTPGELVESPSIGLTQTVKTMTNTASGGALGTPSLIPGNNTNLALTTGDAGRAVDQGDGGHTANTNPLYAVENPAPPGAPSASLTDVGPSAGFGAHGHRTRKPDGTFDVGDAELDDTPQRRIDFPGQEYDGKFEVAALVLAGPMQNTYLGTVEWGYHIDATGNAHPDPAAIRVVSMGTPSGSFMDAADTWNSSQVQDSAGNSFDTVDLPTSRQATVDPATLDDRALLQRIRELTDRLMRMDRRSVDYQQVRFETRGLAAEAVRRGATAADSGHTLTAAGGESLWSIAERELGSGIRWTQIFALNRADILDPNRIATGQVLKMPVPFRPHAAGGTP